MMRRTVHFNQIFINERITPSKNRQKKCAISRNISNNEACIFNTFHDVKKNIRRRMTSGNYSYFEIRIDEQFTCFFANQSAAFLIMDSRVRVDRDTGGTKTRIMTVTGTFSKLSTFELWASSILTLLSSRSNRSCCFRYRSASAKLLLLPCSLCRSPPKAFSSISCEH